VENTGYSRTKKDERSLTLQITGSPSQKVLQFVEKSPSLILTKEQADLALDFQKGKVQITDNRSPENPNIFSLKSSLTTNYLKLFTTPPDAVKSKGNSSHIIEKMQTLLQLKTFYNSPSTLLIRTALTFGQSFSLLESIDDIPQKILELDAFHQYESCQILIHPKGTPTSSSYIYKRSSHIKKMSLEASSFNSFFNLIKKSKNKIFDQSSLTRKELEIVGTFLAKEIELESHRILLILSREDFLPVLPEEQSLFNLTTPLIQKFLKHFFIIQDIEEKKALIKKSLQMIPRSIQVHSKNNTLIFNNNTENEDTSFQTYGQKYHNLIISKRNIAPMISDLYHHQRVSLLGELLNTLQHELSNPLFGLKLAGDLIKSSTDNISSETYDTLSEINNYIDRSQKILENFRSLYREGTQSKPTNIADIIMEAITLSKSETREIRKKLHLQKDIIINLNPTWITQIVFNLIINSAQAIKEQSSFSGAQIEIKLSSENSMATIQITDNGPGIPQDKLDQIFTPFFTTKVQGTGLGLSICQGLAKRLNSTLYCCNNTASRGVTFTLELPLNSWVGDSVTDTAN